MWLFVVKCYREKANSVIIHNRITCGHDIIIFDCLEVKKLLEPFFIFVAFLKMEASDDNSGFDDQLKSISTSHKIFYDNLRSVKGEIVNKSLIQKSEEYLKNLNKRAERLKSTYEIFSKQISFSSSSSMVFTSLT